MPCYVRLQSFSFKYHTGYDLNLSHSNSLDFVSILAGVPDAPHAVNDVSLLAEGNSVGESSLPSVIVSICDDRHNTSQTTNEVSNTISFGLFMFTFLDAFSHLYVRP